MVPWKFRLQEGLQGGFTTQELTLKPGEAPPERINVAARGYMLREVGIEENVGIAIYECIMEVV